MFDTIHALMLSVAGAQNVLQLNTDTKDLKTQLNLKRYIKYDMRLGQCGKSI